jgi:hypothetical protein
MFGFCARELSAQENKPCSGELHVSVFFVRTPRSFEEFRATLE